MAFKANPVGVIRQVERWQGVGVSASFLSSFLIFLITGVFAIFEMCGYAGILPVHVISPASWLNRIHNGYLKALLAISVICAGIYFYYYAAMCEMDEKYKDILRDAGKLEWFIRVLNQTIFMGIWFALQSSRFWFSLYYVCLFLSFIWWDCSTRPAFRRQKPAKEEGVDPVKSSLTWVDIWGLVYALLLFVILNGSFIDEFRIVALAFLGTAYFLWTLYGINSAITKNGFHPFKKELWRRTGLY
jgi:hypothetical protein